MRVHTHTHTLTAQFVLGTSNHVVEDVKSSLCFRLSDTARLFQQVWPGRGVKEHRGTANPRCSGRAVRITEAGITF